MVVAIEMRSPHEKCAPKLTPLTPLPESPQYGVHVVPHPTRPNEDQYSVHQFNGLSLYGVYDGHGGREVSRYAASSIWRCLATADEAALKKAFLAVDAAVISDARLPHGCGSTACVAVVKSDAIIVANCGDSRALLCRGGKVLPLTWDHRPARPDERERILKAGGQILWNEGERVMGVLATTRAIGDRDLKQFGVIAEPEVTSTPRCSEDELLIVATDGVFNVLSNEETADVARRMVARAVQRGATRSAAVRLAASAIGRFSRDRNSKDDITVIVVDLAEQQQGQGQPDAGVGAHAPVQHRQAVQPVVYQEQQQQQEQEQQQQDHQQGGPLKLHPQTLYPPEALTSGLTQQAGSPHDSLLHLDPLQLQLLPHLAGWPPGPCATAWLQEAPCGSLGRGSQPPQLLAPSVGYVAQGRPQEQGHGHGQGGQQQQGLEQQLWGAAGPQAPACVGVVDPQGVQASCLIDWSDWPYAGRSKPVATAAGQLARGGGQRHWMAGGCQAGVETALGASAGQHRPEALPLASLTLHFDTAVAQAAAAAAAATSAPAHRATWGDPSSLGPRVAAPAQEQQPGSKAPGQVIVPANASSTSASAQQLHLRATTDAPGALHPAPGTRDAADARLPAAASAAPGGQIAGPAAPSPFATAVADTTVAQRPDLNPTCVLRAALAAHHGLHAATAAAAGVQSAAAAAAAAETHGSSPPAAAWHMYGFVPVPPSASLEHWTLAPELLAPPPSARSLSETSTGGPPSSGERHTSGSSSSCSCCCNGYGHAAVPPKPSSVVHSPQLPGRLANGGAGADSPPELLRRGQCHVCRGAQVYGSGRPVPYRTQSGSVVGQRQGEAAVLSAAPRARGAVAIAGAGAGLALVQQQEQQQLPLQQLQLVGGPPAVYGGGLYRSRSVALRLPL